MTEQYIRKARTNARCRHCECDIEIAGMALQPLAKERFDELPLGIPFEVVVGTDLIPVVGCPKCGGRTTILGNVRVTSFRQHRCEACGGGGMVTTEIEIGNYYRRRPWTS